MQEDPANRRVNGGTRGHWIVSLIPLSWPEIVTTASGPAVFHADFSPVTAARPARAGEVLIVGVHGTAACHLRLLSRRQLSLDFASYRTRDLVLQDQHVAEIPLIGVRPNVLLG